jgi:hypothetical protein
MASTPASKYVPPHLRNRFASLADDSIYKTPQREIKPIITPSAPKRGDKRKIIDIGLSENDFPELGDNTKVNNKNKVDTKITAADLAKKWAKSDDDARDKIEQENRIREENEKRDRILYGRLKHPLPVAHSSVHLPYTSPLVRQRACSSYDDYDHDCDYDYNHYASDNEDYINDKINPALFAKAYDEAMSSNFQNVSKR